MSSELINRALGLHQGGRLAEAEPIYRQALAAGGDDFQLQFMFAVLLYQLQTFDEAVTAVGKALRRDPNSLDALGLQAALLQITGRPAEALDTLSKIVARQSGNGDAWYNRGVVLIDLERWSEAVESFDRALGVQQTPMAWTNRGSALQRLGRLDEALDSTERALRITPDYGLAHYNRGVVLRGLKRHGEAVAAFDAALAATPQHAEAWIERGAALYETQTFEAAVASYERALALLPQSVRAWTDRGAALHSLGRYADALSSYDHALGLAPDTVTALSGRGDTLARLKRPAEALAAFEAVLKISPQTDVHGRRALALFQLRRFDEALAGYDQALALSPHHADLWHDRSVALTAMQRFDEAMASIDEALKRAPDSPHALLARGKLLCELNQIGEGLDLLSARAKALHGGPLTSDAAPQPHKQKHDAEQAAYQAAQGIATGRYHIEAGERLAGPAVNPANREIAADAWAGSDPKIVVIDNLLTEEGLDALRRFCWGSTVWRKPYRQGYLGAFTDAGFACPLLAQIADELRAVFPTVIADHGLMNTWGFKYDSTLGGIRIHADQAAVNVNFWITPDEANLNPDSGGMVIWDAAAPADWEIERYNGDDDAVRAFLSEAKSTAITVPYRANRAVIFDSDLFHETDKIEFAQGYLNRRINVTMLYGRRTFSNN
jgi:tetratricopeptide (TPR) repeat protein